jgi:hypothetical protein
MAMAQHPRHLRLFGPDLARDPYESRRAIFTQDRRGVVIATKEPENRILATYQLIGDRMHFDLYDDSRPPPSHGSSHVEAGYLKVCIHDHAILTITVAHDRDEVDEIWGSIIRELSGPSSFGHVSRDKCVNSKAYSEFPLR